MYNIIILGLASLLTDFSTEMVYPLIPLYLTIRLGASPAIVGLIEGIAESLASLLKVFSGYFSDRLRRRKPLAIIGYASSTLGKLLLYFSTSWGWVLGSRITDRFGKGIRTAPRDALIAESISSQRYGRAFGLHRAMDTMGAFLGVSFAYYFVVSRVDFSAIFLYSLIPATMGVVLLFLVREKIASGFTAKLNFFQSWFQLDRRLKLFLLIVFLFALGNSSNLFLLLRAKDLGFDTRTILLLYLIYNLVYAFFSYPAGRLSDRIGRKKLLVAGYFLYGSVYLGFAVINASHYLWFLFATYGLYAAFTEGVEKSLVADVAPQTLRATMIGLHATMVGIGLFPASLVAGIFWNIFGAPAPFYLGAALGFLAAVGLYLAI